MSWPFSAFSRHGDLLANYLSFDYLETPSVMCLKDGARLSVLRVMPADQDSRDEAMQINDRVLCARVFQPLPANVSVTFEERRRRRPLVTGRSHFENPTAAWLDARRAAQFQAESYESDFFVYLVEQPTLAQRADASRPFVTTDETASPDLPSPHRGLSEFQSLRDEFARGLMSVFRKVEIYEDSALLTALHGTVSLHEHGVEVPCPPIDLSTSLADTPVRLTLEPMLGEAHLRVLSVLGFPGETVPNMLRHLAFCPFELRAVRRVRFLDAGEVSRRIDRVRGQAVQLRKGLLRQMIEFLTRERDDGRTDPRMAERELDATDALAENNEVGRFVEHTLTACVWADSAEQADENADFVRSALQRQGFTVAVESLAAGTGWLGTVPGNDRYVFRKALVSTRNAADLAPLHDPWTGLPENPHLGGPPLLLARTAGRSAYRLNLHVEDVGHTLVVGPTGAGKSTLLQTMALSFLRYPGAQVVILDHLGSARCLTHALGGDYVDVGADDTVALQPLRAIDRAADRRRRFEWLLSVAAVQGVTRSAEVEAELSRCLKQLAERPVTERTLTVLSTKLLRLHQ